MSKKIIISGAYGVGKSEFCVQWALQNTPCTIGDLDVLNPFFRPREIKEFLKTKGVEVVASHLDKGGNQDTPAMSFAFQKALLEDQNIILDCAGSENGLRPLASLTSAFDESEFYMVLNTFREGSRLNEIESLKVLYEAHAQRKVTGIILNTHLLEETQIEDIIEAYHCVKAHLISLNLPLILTCVERKFKEILKEDIGPVLWLDPPYLREEWMKGVYR